MDSMSVSSVASLVFLSRDDFSLGKARGLGEEQISADIQITHIYAHTHTKISSEEQSDLEVAEITLLTWLLHSKLSKAHYLWFHSLLLSTIYNVSPKPRIPSLFIAAFRRPAATSATES